LLLGSIVHDDNVVLTVDLTNPDIYFGKSLLRSKDAIHIIRAHRRLGARNFGEQSVDLNFSFPSLMISTICSRWAECDARRAAFHVALDGKSALTTRGSSALAQS
jgi:hypothetical protein